MKLPLNSCELYCGTEIQDANNQCIVKVMDGDVKDLAHIVKCVNMYDELVRTLGDISRIIEAFGYTNTLSKSHKDRLEKAKEILAKAKE